MRKYMNPRLAVLAVVCLTLWGQTFDANAFDVTWAVSGSGDWDTTSNNWSGDATMYTEGDNATFNDSAGGIITLTSHRSPGSTSISAAAGTYTFTGADITSGDITKTGAGTAIINSTYTGSGTVSVGTGTLHFNGPYSGAGSFAVNSPGTLAVGGNLTLNTSITGNGTLSIRSGGTLTLTANDQLDDNISMSGTFGTFDMAGFNETIKTLGSGVNITNIGNLTITNGFDHGSGSISGSGMLINDVGANFGLILNGAMSYTGGTYVKSGKFYLYGTSNNILPSTGPVTVDSTGIFSLNYHNSAGRTQTIGALFGTGSIKSSNADTANTIFRVGNGDGDGDFSGVYSGPGSLVKLGTGTQILSGANTYTGTTTVSAGTLIIDGITAGPGQDDYLVESGGTLGGSGTINLDSGKAVNILSGGTLSPGSSPGTLTINGGLTLNDGSILSFELGGASDTVVVNGLLTGSTSPGGITLTLLGSGSGVLLDWTGGSTSGFDLSDFDMTNLPFGDLEIVGTQLIFTAGVPEPASLMLVSLGLLGLVRTRRRRKGATASNSGN